MKKQNKKKSSVVERNREMLESFYAYAKANPKQRMFQALRNWVQLNIDEKWNWLYVSDGKNSVDTFFW